MNERASINVTSASYPVSDFRQLEEAYRDAITLLGHVVNELNFMARAIIASSEFDEDDTIENDIGWSKLLFFARIYLAKIFEAINTLEYLWHKYKKMYSEKITKECRSAIEHLLTYKRNRNGIGYVMRNYYSFHNPHSLDRIAETEIFSELGDSHMLRNYSGKTPLNSFYFSSELLILNAFIKRMFTNEPPTTFGEYAKIVREETDRLQGKLLLACEGILYQAFERLAESAAVQQEFSVHRASLPEQLCLHFFLSTELEG